MASAKVSNYLLISLLLTLSVMNGSTKANSIIGWDKINLNLLEGIKLEPRIEVFATTLILDNSVVIYAAIHRGEQPKDGAKFSTNGYWLVVRDANGKNLDVKKFDIEMPYLVPAFYDNVLICYGRDYLQRFTFNRSTGKLQALDGAPIALNRIHGLAIPDHINKDFVILPTSTRVLYMNASQLPKPSFTQYSAEIFEELQSLAVTSKYIVRYSHLQQIIRLHDKFDPQLRVVKKVELEKNTDVICKFIHASEDSIYCLGEKNGNSSFGVIFDLETLTQKAISSTLDGNFLSSYYLPSLKLFGGVVINCKEHKFVIYPTSPSGPQITHKYVPFEHTVLAASNAVEHNGIVYLDTLIRTADRLPKHVAANINPLDCQTSEHKPGVFCRTCKVDNSNKCVGDKDPLNIPSGSGLDLATLSVKPCSDANCDACRSDFHICTACKSGFSLSELTKTCAKQKVNSKKGFMRFFSFFEREGIADIQEEPEAGRLFEKNTMFMD